MRINRHRHLTYANVMSTVAVILALAGGSTAVSIAAKKSSKAAPKNSVTSKSIRNGSIQAADLAPRAVTSRSIRDGAVAAPDLAPLRVASASNGAAAVQVVCDAGELALAGGGSSATLETLKRSSPLTQAGQLIGWSVAGPDADPGANAQVICLSATPGS